MAEHREELCALAHRLVRVGEDGAAANSLVTLRIGQSAAHSDELSILSAQLLQELAPPRLNHREGCRMLGGLRTPRGLGFGEPQLHRGHRVT